MHQQTLYVGFDDHQVAVQSNAPEVFAGLERNFRQMLKPEPTSIVGRLEVCRSDEAYHLLGEGEARVTDKSLTGILQQLQYELTLQLMQARPKLLWFHAAAAAYQGKAVLISGPWGRGKSTLVTNLCAGGWTYLSDDVVPVEPESGMALPFPQTPMVRENLGQEIAPDSLAKLRKTEGNLTPETVCREAVPVRALVFPSYSLHAPTRLAPCSPAMATLELLQNCLNFVNHQDVAVRYLCELMKYIPAFHLSFNDGKLGAELIAQTLEN